MLELATKYYDLRGGGELTEEQFEGAQGDIFKLVLSVKEIESGAHMEFFVIVPRDTLFVNLYRVVRQRFNAMITHSAFYKN